MPLEAWRLLEGASNRGGHLLKKLTKKWAFKRRRLFKALRLMN